MTLFTVACAAALVALATSVPVDGPVGLTYLDGSAGGSTPPPPPTNATCFLNRFRSFTPSDAKNQGISYRQHMGKEMTWGGTAFDIAMIIIGMALCFVGYKLVEVIFLVAGFGSGLVLTFWAVSSLMNEAPTLFSCWALGIAPLIGGAIGSAILYKIEKLTFFTLGAAIGACIGYYLYVLLVVHLEQKAKLNHDLAEYGSIILPAIICGLVAIKIEKKILAIATAIIGGLMFSIGIVYLILVHIDERFVAWIHPCMFKVDRACTSDYHHVDIMSGFVIGPLVGCVVISITGMIVQLKLQAKKEGVFQPIPYGGYSGNAGIQESGYGGGGKWSA